MDKTGERADHKPEKNVGEHSREHGFAQVGFRGQEVIEAEAAHDENKENGDDNRAEYDEGDPVESYVFFELLKGHRDTSLENTI